MSKSLSKEITDYRVSSVLNNDRKLYGKKYLFDGNEETCWNSDRGSPQWLEFSFPSEKEIKQIVIQFQGGFAAKLCQMEAITEAESQLNEMSSKESVELHPRDTNTVQIFDINNLIASKKFKLTFINSYDFYGRIIIYNIDIMGS